MVFGLGKPNIKKLEKKGDVKGLIKALVYQKDPEILRGAVGALGRIGSHEVVEPPINSHDDEYVQNSVIDVLCREGDPHV